MDTHQQFFPCFQPILNVASGLIAGYEALARQYDQNGQIVSAGKLFTDSSWSAKKLLELDRHNRQLALQRFQKLPQGCYLSLNISASWIDQIDDCKDLPTLKMLESLGVDNTRIVLEITEAAADIDKLREVVRIYRQHGMRIAVDDYGSGFSQLERVLAIQPDIIKIDAQLFKLAAKGGVASEEVQLLTRLGSRMGSQIICEGVETDREFMFGLNSGAHYIQGFLFSGATEDFVDPENFARHVQSLRQKFIQTKTVEEQRKGQRLGQLHELLRRLKRELQADFNLNNFLEWNFARYGVLRFYLCNEHGYQVSPDFNFTENKWFSDPRKIGMNWAWRPYFYQMLAMQEGDRDHTVMQSEHYKDFDTGVLCMTFSLQLDSERILMVDVVVDHAMAE